MDLVRDKVVSEIVARLSQAKGPVKVEGTWGSFARLLTAHISKTLHRPVLHLCAHIDDADRAFDDLKTFGVERIELLPAWEGEEDLADATDETRAQRLRIVSMLADSEARLKDLVIAAPVQALCQPIPKPSALRESALQVKRDDVVDPEHVIEWLVKNNFERVDALDLPGQFARRGGIIDIYAPLARSHGGRDGARRTTNRMAVRIEFFGDTVESIRQINLDTQRSTTEIQGIRIVAAASGAVIEQRELFTNILPEDAVIVLEEPADVEEVAKVFLVRIEKADRLYPWPEIYSSAARFAQLHICRFATGQNVADAPAMGTGPLNVGIKSVQQFERKATSLWAGHKAALEELVQRTKEGSRVLLYCESPAEIHGLREIIKEIAGEVPHDFQLLLGYVHQGFVVESLNTIVVSHHELFGQYALRRRERPARATAPVDTLADLQPGEYVVHASYGVGKFLGTETIEEKGGRAEYLSIEYADSVKIHVSVQNIALVQKYIGTSPKRPTLSKVGTKKWQKQKEKVAESIRDLAAELLEVQAKRQAIGGIAYEQDSQWQMEFEESFPYQETPDQINAVREIKGDMQEPVAMDRLLCGDVGYGKTELAMRAAFKAVESGKQVAVLVPTTVLSVQHERTFRERFADFPVTVEVLNRFRTGRQAKDIARAGEKGEVDILIGTHRLLSGDVAFKDLGLLIIDEEQRFGVEHKERLKRMRVNVDILTMTATPIPRTLHMAMLGLRDISSLTHRAAGPPEHRHERHDLQPGPDPQGDLSRAQPPGPGVFPAQPRPVHREEGLGDPETVPDARVNIAHGQMSERELEDAMVKFVLGRPTCWSARRSSNRAWTSRTPTRSSSTTPTASAWPSCTSFAAGSGGTSTGPTPTCCCRTPGRSRRSRPSGSRRSRSTRTWARASGSPCATLKSAAPATSSAPSSPATSRWSVTRCTVRCWPTRSAR